MSNPYYVSIRDVNHFLEFYSRIYESDYNKARAEKIVSLIPNLEEKKVLDLGCGGGFYSIAALGKRSNDVTMVDISPVCVKAARLNMLRASGSSFEGIIAEATCLPFRNEWFDFVVSVDIIEHLRSDRKALFEFKRVIKNNGLLMIATQNSSSINYVIEATVQRRLFRRSYWMGWDPTHVRFYNRKNLAYLLNECGFNLLRLAGTYFIPYLISTWLDKINLSLSKAFYRILKQINEKVEVKPRTLWDSFGWGIICLCRKRKSQKE